MTSTPTKTAQPSNVSVVTPMPTQSAPQSSNVSVVTSTPMKATSQTPTAPVTRVVYSPEVARLRGRIEAVCGKLAKDMEVKPDSPTSLQVRFKVRTAEDGERLGMKIMQMPELAPYKVSLDVQVGQ